jgi:hypothetical protein
LGQGVARRGCLHRHPACWEAERQGATALGAEEVRPAQLATVVDFGSPIMQTMYALEGDGPVVLYTYEMLLTLHYHIRQPNLPNAAALARAWPTLGMDSIVKGVISPAVAYFQEKFGDVATCVGGALSDQLTFYKWVRLCDPEKLTSLNASPADVDALAAVFPRLARDGALIARLKAELAAYKAAATELPDEFNVLDWWLRNKEKLKSWFALVRLVLLAVPSSTAAEHVFSVLRNSFGNRQNKALADYIRTSLMLQYNYRDGHLRGRDRRAP